MFTKVWRAVRDLLPFASRKADRCIVCRGAIRGRFRKDAFGICVCVDHAKSTVQCRWCTRLVARSLGCSVCKAAAIVDTQRAKLIFKEIAGWCSRQGLRFDPANVGFKLGGDIAGAGGTTNQHRLGVTESLLNVKDNGLRKVTVSVIPGMPEPLFRSVVAHECVHVWTAIHRIRQTQVAEEGLAEVVSYLYVKSRRGLDYTVLARRMEKNPDPVYGSGFRSVQATVEYRGLRQYIRSLQAA